MRYQIEADWHLLNTCNYRCDYCFFSDEQLGAKLQTFANAKQWGEAFDRSGLVWLLHLTGGEPSVYPEFGALCEALTRRHFISVNSNMTGREWQGFARRIDPSRVSFLNAGLHLAEREHRAGLPIYLDNVASLRDRGFQILCSLVGTPAALARFEEAIELLAAIDMFPVPKVMRGVFGGRRYPDAYSDLDKERFRKYAGMARAFYARELARRAEPPTIDMFGDDQIIDGEPSFRDASCEAGHLFVRIDPKGELFRCGTSDSMGNILAGTFNRRTSAAPCDTSYCFYFCQKYADKQNGRPIDRAAAVAFD